MYELERSLAATMADLHYQMAQGYQAQILQQQLSQCVCNQNVIYADNIIATRTPAISPLYSDLCQNAYRPKIESVPRIIDLEKYYEFIYAEDGVSKFMAYIHNKIAIWIAVIKYKHKTAKSKRKG